MTGPKTDDWLVRMVGLLAASIGVTLLTASRALRPRSRAGPADQGPARILTGVPLVLATTAAVSFCGIDLRYVLDGTIRPIYLGDAVVELLLLGFLAALWLRLRAAR